MVGKARGTIRGTARSTTGETGSNIGGQAFEKEEGHGVTGTEQFGEHTAGEELADDRDIAGATRDFTGRGDPGGNIQDLVKTSQGHLGMSAGRGEPSQVEGKNIAGGGASPETSQEKDTPIPQPKDKS